MKNTQNDGNLGCRLGRLFVLGFFSYLPGLLMLKRMKYVIAVLLLSIVSVTILMFSSTKLDPPQSREIAITIDDLPIVPIFFEKIIQSLNVHKAPAIGFVIASRVDGGHLNDLKPFLNENFLIGNHSYSHVNLKKTTAEFYISDLERADKILSPLISGTKYFRYPYLAKARFQKKQQVLNYLAAKHYVVAPVTVDSRDFKFNLELINAKDKNKPKFLKQLKQRYFKYTWEQTLKAERKQKCPSSKQILMLHANALNSYFLNDLLQMYEDRGYRFITLKEALAANC